MRRTWARVVRPERPNAPKPWDFSGSEWILKEECIPELMGMAASGSSASLSVLPCLQSKNGIRTGCRKYIDRISPSFASSVHHAFLHFVGVLVDVKQGTERHGHRGENHNNLDNERSSRKCCQYCIRLRDSCGSGHVGERDKKGVK